MPAHPSAAVMGVPPCPSSAADQAAHRLGSGRPQLRVSACGPPSIRFLPFPFPSPPFSCSDSPLSPFCHWQPRGVRAPGALPSPPAFPFLPACILTLLLCLFSRRPHAGATVPRGAGAAFPVCPWMPRQATGKVFGKLSSPQDPDRRRCKRSTSRFASSLSPGPWRRGSSRGQLPGSWGPAVLEFAG